MYSQRMESFRRLCFILRSFMDAVEKYVAAVEEWLREEGVVTGDAEVRCWHDHK